MIDQSEIHQTVEELQASLGERVHAYRVSKDIGQVEAARKAGVSLRTMKYLENGGRTTLETLVRVLRALDAPDPLASLVPTPQVSPMALLRSSSPPQRASRKRPGAA
jgi:transcriptional regulator with XRE-family HTH domain